MRQEPFDPAGRPYRLPNQEVAEQLEIPRRFRNNGIPRSHNLEESLQARVGGRRCVQDLGKPIHAFIVKHEGRLIQDSILRVSACAASMNSERFTPRTTIF